MDGTDRGMNDNYAFADLPLEAFPFTIVFTRIGTGEEVHRIVVDGPGALAVPPLVDENGVGVEVQLLEGKHP